MGGGYFLCGALCLYRSSRVRKLCCRRKGRSPPPSIVRSMQDIERGVRQCDSEVSDNENRESTNATPRTSSPLSHLESAPVPNFIVETVPLKSILSETVDPKVESTQKAKKSVHWARELVRIKITMTHFQRLSNPRSDFKPWTHFQPWSK